MVKIPKSFWEELQEAKQQWQQVEKAEPWGLRLERLRGKVVFDVLEVPQRNRGAGACRRLAKAMGDLGWSPIKARGLNQRGLREQIRGYARDKDKLTVM
jgi:hypothetical protein